MFLFVLFDLTQRALCLQLVMTILRVLTCVLFCSYDVFSTIDNSLDFQFGNDSVIVMAYALI